jgi:molybdate transport system ATP-binding protein
VVTATHREEEIFPGVTRLVRLEGGRVADDRRLDGLAAAGRGPDGRGSDGRGSDGRRADGRLAVGRVPSVHAPDGRPAVGRGPAGRPLQFDLRDVTVLVDGRPVLDRVNWSVQAGEAWGVTGPNGAGKSTLLRLLAGEEQPASGAIDRLDLGPRADAGQVRLRVGQVSPELQARHRFDASGEAVVLSGFLGTVGLAAPPTAPQREAASALLDRLGLAGLRARRFLACSYGEQRLLLVARALVAGPEALLLDEPFAGLSPEARRLLRDVLGALRDGGTTLVLVSHHEDELDGVVERRARLAAGRLALER